MPSIETAIQRFRWYADSDTMGYSWPHRNDPNETDCSQLVGRVLSEAGFDIDPSACSSYTLPGILEGIGFARHDNDGNPQDGDVLIYIGDWSQGTGHVAMMLHDGNLGQATIDENGQVGYEGTEPGDQTGTEVETCPYYDDGWDGYWRYEGAQEPANPQEPGDPVNDFQLWYRSHVEDFGWLDAVRDGQVSGTTGKGKRLEALLVDTRSIPGLRIGMKAHIEGIGWRDFGELSHDTQVGTVGEAKRIECLLPYVVENTTGKAPKMSCHVQDVGWEAPVDFGYSEGSTGECRRIEAVKFWME